MGDNPQKPGEVPGGSKHVFAKPSIQAYWARRSTSANVSTSSVGKLDSSRASSSATGKTGAIKSLTKTEADKAKAKKTATLSYITAAEVQVFTNFVNSYKATGKLRKEDVIALDFMFGPTILQVFELVEEDHVSIRKSPVSRKILIEVAGKSDSTYWIPPGHSLCQCMAYLHGKKDYCKHVLAAHLALAITPPENYKPMSDEELTKIYKELIEDALK